MSVERIDSVYDIAALEGEGAKFAAMLAQHQKQLVEYWGLIQKNKNVDLGGFIPITEKLNEKTLELLATEKKLTDAIREKEQANRKAAAELKEKQIKQKELDLEAKKASDEAKKRNAEELTEIRRKANAEKEAAAEAKKKAAEEVAAGRERILQLKQEQEEIERVAQAERDRAAAEAQHLGGSGNGQNARAQLKSTVSEKAFGAASFIPNGLLEEQQLQILKLDGAIKQLSIDQKEDTALFKAGEITQAEYKKRIVESGVQIGKYKSEKTALNKEIKNTIILQKSEQDSINKLKAELSLLTEKYNKLGPAMQQSVAGQDLNKRIVTITDNLKAQEAEQLKFQRNVGNYAMETSKVVKMAGTEVEKVGAKTAGSFGKIYGGMRTLANILPGLGISGLLLLLFTPLQAAAEGLIKNVFTAKGATVELKKRAEELKKALGEINEEAIKTSTADITKLDLLREILIDTTKSTKERNAALVEYNSVADKNNQIDASQINNLNLINTAISKQISLIEKRAFTTAGEKILSERAEKLLLAKETARVKAEIEQANEDKYNIETAGAKKVDSYFKNLEREAAIRRKIAANEDVKDAQREFDAAKSAFSKIIDLQNGAEFKDPGKAGKVKAEKKAREEISHIADEFNKKDLEALAKAARDELLILKEKYKTEAEDQRRSTDDRLNSYALYYAASRKLIEIDKQAALDGLDLEVETAKKKAKNQDDRNAIAKYYADKRITIEKDASLAISRIIEDESKFATKLLEDASEKQSKIYAERQKQSEQAKLKSIKDRESEIQTEKYNKLADLDIAYQEGRIKNEKAYQAERDRIEKEATQKILQEKLTRLQFQLLLDARENKSTKELLEEIARLRAELAKGAKEEKERLTKEEIESLDKILFYYREGMEIIGAIAGGINDKEKNRIQEQIDLSEEKKQRDIENVNALAISEEEKANRILVIEKTAQVEKERLEQRQRALDQQRARFEKQLKVMILVGEIAIALAKGRYDQAIAGGVALAKLIATPIPKFKHGKTDAYSGPAIVGDGGVPEYIHREDGTIEKTPSKNTLTFLKPRDIVYRDKQTMQKALAFSAYPVNNIVNESNGLGKDDIQVLGNRIEDAVSNIRIETTRITKEGWRVQNQKLSSTDRWVEKYIKN